MKGLAWSFVLLFGLQMTACKSKQKPADTTTTTVTDTAATVHSAPVEIMSDDVLKNGLKDATKDYPGVEASVDDGVVTLTGPISRDRLPNLLAAVNSLHPKKTNNQLTIK